MRFRLLDFLQTYLIAKPHNASRRSHGDEATGHESLDARSLGGFGQWDLIVLLGRPDTADHHLNVGQSLDQFLLGGLQVALADLDPAFLQPGDRRLVGGDGTDERIHLLFSISMEEAPLVEGNRTKRPSSSNPLAMEPPVSPAAPTSRTLVFDMVCVCGRDAAGGAVMEMMIERWWCGWELGEGEREREERRKK